VLAALRDRDSRLTVIVSIAYEHEDELQQRLTGASVEDLRRSLEAQSCEEGTLLRAIRRPLTVERLGRHPLGNLVIASTAAAFDDYGRASTWLGDQLGIAGVVLPATTELVRRQIETAHETASGKERTVSRLRFCGDRLESPGRAVSAIEQADWVLLAPGALYRSILSSAAVPNIASALRATRGRVLWIANLEADGHETANMSAVEHLLALRSHGLHIDMVMHDPSASLKFDPAELAVYGVRSVARTLRSTRESGVHDRELLRSALSGVIGLRPATGAQM
jgi:uncharacterized cofD-like protein